MRTAAGFYLLSAWALGYESLLKLQPSLTKEVAQGIYNQVSKCDAAPKNIFLSLIFKESSFKINPKHPNSNDVGMTAINMRWWKKPLNIDVERLRKDYRYAIELSCKILHIKKKKFFKKDPDYFWSYYHSSTPKLRLRYKRQVLAIARRLYEQAPESRKQQGYYSSVRPPISPD